MAQGTRGVKPRSMKVELAPPITLVEILLPLIFSKASSARLPKGSRPHGAPLGPEFHVPTSIATPERPAGVAAAPNPALCLVGSRVPDGLEFGNTVFLTPEQEIGKP